MKNYIIYRSLIVITLMFLLWFGPIIQRVEAKENLNQGINADAYIVIDSKTGEIILEKNKNKRHYPASITKIVTAIIAIEERELNEIVTISQHAQNTEGSSLSLIAGDKISLKDLLYGIMLHSGNDGAVAIAEHISNNETEFSQKMTFFAKSIGANNTQFINASGLPNDKHYTTANDMAIIARYAMKNKVFKEMVQHKQYTYDSRLWRDELMEHEKTEAAKFGVPWEGIPKIINHNGLLGIYDGATGVKNGFTHEARYTLVGSAEKNGTEIIVVLLRSENSDTAYKDMLTLLDEGFKLNNEKANKLIANKKKELESAKEWSNKEEEIAREQNNPFKTLDKFEYMLLPGGIFSVVLFIFLIVIFIVKIKQKR
ncbi:D-alanyl-D-alanine carboxypeptidase family protein [Niallia oryzisoli]|uniref:D-alanyl-D-alanine carboxypeptidase family protein n=1 Tax=Niallia oryzisoli TaxID=1737571 RepID=UPI0037352B0A